MKKNKVGSVIGLVWVSERIDGIGWDFFGIGHECWQKQKEYVMIALAVGRIGQESLQEQRGGFLEWPLNNKANKKVMEGDL